ncbi:MAG: lactonase family protein [Anaerorhabdus sp.]
MRGYCGTYTNKKSEGIYSFDFDEDSGILSNSKLFTKIKSPKSVCYDNGYLFSVFENEEGAGICVIDDDGNIIDSIISEKAVSCFICTKDDLVFTANYHDGSFSVYSFQKKQLKLIFRDIIKPLAGCHHVQLIEDLILVPCLKLDQIHVYDNKFNKVDIISVKKNSGPRNGIYLKDEKRLLMLMELSDSIVSFDYINNKFVYNKEYSLLLDNDKPSQSAALKMTSNGLLLASIRKRNIVSVIKDDVVVQNKKLDSDHPRDILISSNDKFVIVASRDSDMLVSYEIVNERIKNKVSEIVVNEAISICLKGD